MLLSSLIVGPVHAIPLPVNDDALEPTVIAEAPFTAKQKTLGATVGVLDPEPGCADVVGNTVWYAYTATTDGLIHADTFGSNYDTVLSVYTFPEQATFELVTCNSDFPEGHPQSSVDFQAVAGETYFFMIGAAPSVQGGALTFNLEVDQPFEISVQFGQEPLLEPDDVFLFGEVVCTRPTSIAIEGTLTQKVKGVPNSVSFTVPDVSCDFQGSFFLTVPGLFAPGKATVVFTASATFDGEIATTSDKVPVSIIVPEESDGVP
ncbi:hypothetical protein [Nannocystis radixulma]|uniref:Bacterial Ig-like domain-containing protein n=1 Tax=Nannocystis radixulma TaxID=2995305 RepID=A0ABT5BGP1_9BACT|nr:hypothetical protein [Nannocystis radixulma]MDC0672156.1 hypothetical protein [Nannocystis radixulma]